jgi:hypothetical protein
MIRIPNEQKQFRQSNSTDRFGNIYRTKNISFDKKGYITVSPVTRVVASSEDLADLQTNTAIGVMGGAIARNNLWIYADKNIYKSTIGAITPTFPTFTKDTETGTPVFGASAGVGAINWDGNLLTADGTSIDEWSGSAWSAFNGFGAYFIESFEDRNLLAVADDDEARVYDRAGNLIQTILVADDLRINAIKWNNSRLYIATNSNLEIGQKSLLIEWDSLANSASNQYWVNAQSIMSLTPFEQGVAFTTNDGFLGYCYGGVQELDHFPVYGTENAWQRSDIGYQFNRVCSNGMNTDDGKLYITVNSQIDTGTEDNTEFINPLFPSGVWCFDREVGLHHKYSIGQSKCLITNDIATTDVNTTTDVITVAGATVPETGTPCFYRSNDVLGGTMIGGLKVGVRYFVIKVSDTEMKVATSRSNAIAGTAIDLTGTGNNDQKFTFHLENDFGGVANRATSISYISGSNTRWQGSWLLDKFGIGGLQQTGTGTSAVRATFSVNQKYLENRGWLITPKLESSMLEDNFATIALKWNKLKTEDQKIIIKYKTRDSDLDEFLTNDTPYFTLTANNTLTTTQDLSGVEVGDEIEFVRGAGAGYLAHITSISEDTGTYTVVFDEQIRNFTANERGQAVFTKWQKLQTITKDDEDNDIGYRAIRLAEKSKWAMFKIELRGWDTSISDILIDNKPQKPVSV